MKVTPIHDVTTKQDQILRKKCILHLKDKSKVDQNLSRREARSKLGTLAGWMSQKSLTQV